MDVGASVGINLLELQLLTGAKHGILIEYMPEACRQAVVFAAQRGLRAVYVVGGPPGGAEAVLTAVAAAGVGGTAAAAVAGGAGAAGPAADGFVATPLPSELAAAAAAASGAGAVPTPALAAPAAAAPAPLVDAKAASHPLLSVLEAGVAKGTVYIFEGDVTGNLPAIRDTLAKLRADSGVDAVLVTAHAVLHELPTRSPGFTAAGLLEALLLGVPKWALYAREPSFPADAAWQPGKLLHVQLPGWKPRQLDHHLATALPGLRHTLGSIEIVDAPVSGVSPSPVIAAGAPAGGSGTSAVDIAAAKQAAIAAAEARSTPQVLRCDAVLAMEVLYKSLYYISSQHLAYETGEQLTSFNAADYVAMLRADPFAAANVDVQRYLLALLWSTTRYGTPAFGISMVPGSGCRSQEPACWLKRGGDSHPPSPDHAFYLRFTAKSR